MNKDQSPKSSPVEALGKPWVAALCLTLVMLAVYPLFAFYARSIDASMGFLAEAVAGFVCWLGAILALIVTSLFRGTPAAIQGILLGMIFRFGLPLVIGVVLSRQGGALAQAGVFGLIVAYYLVGLVAETLLSLQMVATGERTAKAS